MARRHDLSSVLIQSAGASARTHNLLFGDHTSGRVLSRSVTPLFAQVKRPLHVVCGAIAPGSFRLIAMGKSWGATAGDRRIRDRWHALYLPATRLPGQDAWAVLVVSRRSRSALLIVCAERAPARVRRVALVWARHGVGSTVGGIIGR
jgi:hypothetical protein